jgi:hypothetical protein
MLWLSMIQGERSLAVCQCGAARYRLALIAASQNGKQGVSEQEANEQHAM